MEIFRRHFESPAFGRVKRPRPAQQSGEVTPATDPRFGDYQTNAALILAKQRGENPRQLAARIVAGSQVSEWCEAPLLRAPVSLTLDFAGKRLLRRATELLQHDRLGVERVDQPRRS